MYGLIGDEFKFIETSQISLERKKLGWGEDIYPDYVIPNAIFQHSKSNYIRLIDDADIVILGSAPYALIENRLKNNKPVFIYSERLYKGKYQYYKMPVRAVRFFKKFTRYKNVRLLCASAYAASDYAKTLTFLNRAYKWGYFTSINTYPDIHTLIDKKHTASLLWVARFIPVKHPEAPIEVAKRLKENGYEFELNLIGNGELQDKIDAMIKEYNLTGCVKMLGAMKPDEVREHMEKNEIFLFTSDRGEGWGAVLNESMNSACAVVASHAIGSVPFMVEDGKNGLIYKDGDIDDLYKKVVWLLEHPEERKTISANAYDTMISEWNAENAAKKFIHLSERVLAEEKTPFPFESGVCSKPKLLKDNWYK